MAMVYHGYLDLAGFPTILRSDNGPEFTADLTRELNRLIGATQIFGSAYHPRSQALIEGSHRPTEDVLTAFIKLTGEDWALRLPICRWAWNTTAKKSLGNLSPYQVVTAMRPRSPLASYLAKSSAEQVTAEEHVKEVLEATKEIHDLVQKAQERRAAENAK